MGDLIADQERQGRERPVLPLVSSPEGAEAQSGEGREGRRKPNWHLTAGIALLAGIAIVCLAAPLITPIGPSAQDLFHAGAPPLTNGHLLGTDAPYGRDLLSRLLYGGRADLLIVFGATGVTFVFGTLIGLVAGYFGRWADALLMRLADVFFAFPFLVLILAIVAMLGPSLLHMLFAIWTVSWVSYARIIRGAVLQEKNEVYVEAARVVGCSHTAIMFRHVLGNVISVAIIYAMADAVVNILLAASLGYLGLGVPEPAPEWGAMVVDGQNYMLTQWWVPTIPGLAIALVGVAFSLIGDGLADRLRAPR